MISNIDNPSNCDKIAIVVVGFNRLVGLIRLLNSINDSYYDSDDIPLVISIDASGNQELYRYVENFEWKHGKKYVNIEKERLGLRAHILQCGDLTRYFKAIALFEDDLWVSPYYYNYLEQAVNKYGEDPRICEISLYRNERLGEKGFYFDVYHDGSDSFLWQDISTWGECWTSQMWTGFRQWLESHDDEYIKTLDIPDAVKNWTRAWSKYFLSYEIDTHKYVVFPYESLTTNFNDAGGEHGGGNNKVQVNVLQGPRNYHFKSFEELTRYDLYTNNEQLYDWLPEVYRNDIYLDLYGERSSYPDKRYVLSTKNLPYSAIQGWGIEMRPIEINVLYNIQGGDIRVYDTTRPLNHRINAYNEYSEQVIHYFLRGINLKNLIGYIRSVFFKRISSRIRRKK